MGVVKVKSTGKKHNCLMDYVFSEREKQQKCSHRSVEVREIVSGMGCEVPHYNLALVCKRCGAAIETVRMPISKRLGKLLGRRKS